MSHIGFEPGKMVLDFSKGFSWISLLKIVEQKREGRKTIFEIEHVDTPFKLTIGLDKNNDFNVWLRDINNKNFLLEPLPSVYFFNKWASVICELSFDNSTKLSSLSLSLVVDNETYNSTKEIKADIGSESHLNLIIGSNLNHEENAAFTMSNLKIYNTVLDDSEKNMILDDLQNLRG